MPENIQKNVYKEVVFKIGSLFGASGSRMHRPAAQTLFGGQTPPGQPARMLNDM